jgi:hypothetical protein
MSNLLMLAVCNEPRALMLGCTVLEIYRRNSCVCVVGVRCRNWFEGAFIIAAQFCISFHPVVL